MGVSATTPRGAFCLAVGALIASLATAGPSDAPACVRRTFEGSVFTVCAFDAKRNELRLVWRGQAGRTLRSFVALAEDLGGETQRVQFAMNAGMFDADGAPVGLFTAGGIEEHPLEPGDGSGNFYLKPNGVLSVDRDGTVHVETAAAFAVRHRRPASATQSGPMLVVDGALHPAIAPDGPSRTVRNGVGVHDPSTAVFAISDAPVSFGRLARLFRDELHCRNALFLDGAISSAWIPSTGRRDAHHALGPMLVVLAP